MGIGFVLLIWSLVGAILAGIGALVFGGAATFFTRGGERRQRKRVILVAALFPFACLIWAGAVFVFQAVINEAVLHRDAGTGDMATCPLPDGYAILMIDVFDQGVVYNPKTQTASNGVTDQDDALDGVRTIQLAGPYILGGQDRQSFHHQWSNTTYIDSYFLLDTRVGKHSNFPTYDQLRGAAQKLGITLSLEPINIVYSRYRFTWFDITAICLLCVPPLVCAWLLLRWIVRLRRTRDIIVKAA